MCWESLGIGIASGLVLGGNVGSEHYAAFVVLGTSTLIARALARLSLDYPIRHKVALAL